MEFIAKPFGWLLMTLYEFVGNYGLAVILFALIVKAILLPFQMKAKRGTMKTARLQPKLKELEKKHGANKQKLQEETARLYREEKVNPASGCLWSLIPLPILLALFSAVSRPITTMMGVAQELLAEGGAIFNALVKYGGPLPDAGYRYLEIEQVKFISNPEYFSFFKPLSESLRQIDYNFLGMNLGNTPQWKIWEYDWSDVSKWGPAFLLFLLPVASGILAFFSTKISMKLNPQTSMNQQQASTNNMMTLMMPIMQVWFAFIMPAAIGIYIIASTLFAMIQDIILTKHYTKILEAEEAVRLEQQRIRDAELEAKRLETERRKLENATEKNPNTSKKKQLKTERQEQLEKAVEWEKKNSGQEVKPEDPSRVGERRFARGRAYDPSRYEQTETTSEQPPEDEADVNQLANETAEGAEAEE